ncbi:MAG: NAD(P)-dependent oxidoreductase [Bacteroidota bacterium]
MKKVLVTDGVNPLLLQGFEEAGFEVDYHPKISLDQTRTMIPAYHGLIINSKILVDRNFLDLAVQLEWLGRLGSGMEIVDKAYAKSKGVGVYSSPEGNRNAVAEQALGMLLMLANKLLVADREVRAMHWDREKNRGFELSGRTIGLIGFGHTGSQFARKLAGMDMRVLAYDKYKKNYASDFPHVRETTLDEILAKADIISFHLPLTNKTRQLADKSFCESCKKGVILVNTSRGSIVNTADLVEGLSSGQLGGACLDVFENEKPPTFSETERQLYNRLYTFENVVLSPHIAGWTVESKGKLARILLEKILSNHSA